MAQPTIMIVDNEIEIIEILRLYLSHEGYHVIWTIDSSKAMQMISGETPDLILLDVVMPTLNGIDLCAQIREKYETPIIFLSCKNQTSDKVLGLSIGGDDYITKPFVSSELIARVKANLRRSYRQINYASKEKSNILTFGELYIDLSAYTASIQTTPLNLTTKEFELLSLLAGSPNRVFTAKQIFEHLWKTYGIEEDYRTVLVHMSNLRKKLERFPTYADRIQTVRGVGYKFIDSQ